MYELRQLPPTPEQALNQARRIALDTGVRYAYIGNVRGSEGEHTICPHDGTVLIRRVGYHILERNLTPEGRCPSCARAIPGVWS